MLFRIDKVNGVLLVFFIIKVEFVLFKSNILSVVMSERSRYEASLTNLIVPCVPLDSPSCVSLSKI